MPTPVVQPKPPSGNDAKKSGDAMTGAFSKALGASQKLAKGISSLGAASRSLASGALPTASSAAHSFGSAVGGVATDGAQKLSEALGQLGPAGQAAGAAIQAAAAIFAATAGTLAGLAGIAIEVTQNLDLMRDRFNAFAGSAAGGRAVTETVDKLASSLPFAKSQVEAWATSLLKAGVSAKDLEDRIKAVAAAEALSAGGGAAAESFFKRLGEGGPAADKFIKELAKGSRRATNMLKEMGVTMADLGGAAAVSKMSAEQLSNAVSKALQKKGKSPLEDLALTLPNILQKAREGFLSLFAKLGPAVKPFMKAVKELFGQFNKGTPIMKTLQGVMTRVFTVVFQWGTKAVHAVRDLIQGFMGGKKAKGPFAEIGAAIRKVVDSAMALIGVLAKLNKGSPSGLSSALNALVFIVKAVAASIAFMIDEATAALAILGALGDIADSAMGALSGLADGAMSAASSFIDGLVGGITSGAGAVVDAVSNLASSALSAFKSKLGIASPSKVMMRMGAFTGEGAAQGLDQSAGKVEDSAASLGAGVKSGAAKGMAGAGGKGKGGGITINGGVHIEVPMGTPSAWAEEAWASFMERLAASQGAT